LTCVVDASVVAAGLLPDEAGLSLADLAARDPDLCAPHLLTIEVWNLMLVAERRGRIDETQCDFLLDRVEAVQLRLDGKADRERSLQLARKHRLSAYDVLYLELALREQAFLATLDSRLAAAARAEGLQVI
jgi:predicted nucleic acid-binding protein